MDSMEKGLSFRGGDRDRGRRSFQFQSSSPPFYSEPGGGRWKQQAPPRHYSYRLRRLLNQLQRRFPGVNWRVAAAASALVFLLVFFSTTLYAYRLLFRTNTDAAKDSSAIDDKQEQTKTTKGTDVGVGREGEGFADSEMSPPLSPLFQPTAAFCAMDDAFPLVCAHGGDSTSTTPNTKKAFAAALKEGAECVEVDVAAAKDGNLFVLHRRELTQILKQLTSSASDESDRNKPSLPQSQSQWWKDRPAKVEEFTAKEIAKMRTEDGQKVLPVKDVLQVLLKDKHVKHVILDIKTHNILEEGKEGERENVQQMVDSVTKLVVGTEGCLERCVVWAKSDAVIKGVSAELPRMRVGMTVMNETKESRDLGLDKLDRMEDLGGGGVKWVAMHWEMVSDDVMARAHALGKKVFGWTANTDKIASHILKHAADGVVTNYPSKVRKQISVARELCATHK